MIGLIYKDLLSIKKSMTRILFVLAVYVVVFMVATDSSSFLSAMIVALSAMLVMNSFAYDEVSKWDYYALSLPITKRQLVLSRYVLCFLMNLCGTLLAFLPGLFRGQLNLEFMLTLYSVSAVAFLLMAVLLPLLFRFGTQKARIWLFLLYLIPTVLAFVVSNTDFLPHVPSLNTDVVEILLWFSLPVALILLVLSYFISYAVMKNKEF